MTHSRLVAALCAVLAVSCSSPAERTAQRQAALEKARAEKKSKDDATSLAPLPEAPAVLDDFWGTPDDVVLEGDRACPEGLWSLFPGTAPGANSEERKANTTRREVLATALRAKRFRVKLRAPEAVALKAYDAPNGNFPLEVHGSVDCTDSAGHITVAWTKAVATAPAPSAGNPGGGLVERIWAAEPLTWQVPMKSLGEARDFDNKNKLQLSARILLKLGAVDVDTKPVKVPKAVEKVQGETITLGGGTEDWGAGRLVRAQLLGVRVATDREKTQLFERRSP